MITAEHRRAVAEEISALRRQEAGLEKHLKVLRAKLARLVAWEARAGASAAPAPLPAARPAARVPKSHKAAGSGRGGPGRPRAPKTGRLRIVDAVAEVLLAGPMRPKAILEAVRRRGLASPKGLATIQWALNADPRFVSAGWGVWELREAA